MNDPEQAGPRLSPRDAEALDALAQAGFDPGRVDAAHRPGAEAAAKLLGLLSRGGHLSDRTLGDVAFARATRGAPAAPAAGSPFLCSQDDDALAAWVTHGFDAARVPTPLRSRADRHETLAAMISRGPVLDAPALSLADGAMARIQAEMERQRGALSFEAAARGRRTFQLADLMSVAAVLLIGAAVIWPVMGAVREQNRRGVCTANLAGTASAMASYASSNRDSLPVATASMGDRPWWDVGSGHANSANLFTLVRDGYTTLSNLACPGNPNARRGECDRTARDWRTLEEVSYSMQLVYGPQRRSWDASNPQPVLADRSPVVLQAMRGELINPFSNAPNHQFRGQCVLYTDGTVRWYLSPILPNGDNIWLPRVIENHIEEVGRELPPGSLSGRELPDGADDTVLGP